MMTGDRRCMIDTNVLVYSTVISSPRHEESRQRLAELLNGGIELCLTPQIAREYLVVLTRGSIFEQQFTEEEALGELKVVLPALNMLGENEETFRYLCNLIKRYKVRGKAVHDANIVAVMLAHGVTRLMTYNTDDFRRFQEITMEPI